MVTRMKPIYDCSLVGSHTKRNAGGRHRESSDKNLDNNYNNVCGDLSEISDPNIRELVFKLKTGTLDSC